MKADPFLEVFVHDREGAEELVLLSVHVGIESLRLGVAEIGLF
jgi:hypothetical protein